MDHLTPEERIKVRKATKDDFANPDGSKKINVPYYLQSSTGKIESTKHYFNHATNMAQFKTFYAARQIYVPKNPNDLPVNNNP